MIRMDVRTVAEITGGHLMQNGASVEFQGISTDSRTLQPGEAVLRLYAWTHPTVSFGRNEPARERWRGRARGTESPVDVVRRPTGGRAVLHDANLESANLIDASLRATVLSNAYMVRAKLKGADLSGADLSGAQLTQACLTGTNLTGANLTGADLTGADFTGAIYGDAKLAGAKLAGVTGMPA